MADEQTTNQNGTSASIRVSEKDWNDMCDQRDSLDKMVEDALARKSVRMAGIFINDRANLSVSLKKTHNMRERDKLATYRKRLEDLKDELDGQIPGAGEDEPEEAAV